MGTDGACGLLFCAAKRSGANKYQKGKTKKPYLLRPFVLQPQPRLKNHAVDASLLTGSIN
jgi:hypothetical protein